MKEIIKLYSESWYFYKRYYQYIWVVIAPVVLMLAIVESVDATDFSNDVSGLTNQFILLLTSLVGYSILLGVMVFLLSSINQQVSVSIKQLYKNAGKYFFPLAISQTLVGFAILAGFLLLIVPGIFLLGRLALVEFYLLLEDKGVKASIDTSSDVTKEKQWLIGFGTIFIYVGYQLIIAALAEVMALVGLPEMPTSVILSGVLY